MPGYRSQLGTGGEGGGGGGGWCVVYDRPSKRIQFHTKEYMYIRIYGERTVTDSCVSAPPAYRSSWDQIEIDSSVLF